MKLKLPRRQARRSAHCCSAMAVWAGLWLGTSACAAEPTAEIEFNRDIRPILSDTCFPCHGPDEQTREASLRLDVRELAMQAADSGAIPILPGKPDESEFIRRIFSDDPDEHMPPEHAHKQLTAAQRELLYQWIAQDAPYQSHWAYAPLRRPAVAPAVTPAVTPAADQPAEAAPTASAIDAFIDAGLRKAGLPALPAADPITLLRRLSLDLTGLPPTPAEVDAFVADSHSGGYVRQVNRLLDSPRFGERLASYWLDLVRYADTVGYHGDQDVSQSPYRDYVIDAFNSNLSYDRFVLEQIAGDLLPNATADQLIASGYNRLNQTTEEGGAQPKEYLAIYFADRVRNVSQVFMGATLGCAQCHDHKYDPYTARDFYSFGAFFADLEEVGKYSARSRPPELRLPTDQQQKQLDEFDERIAKLTARGKRIEKKLLAQQSAWEQTLSGEGELPQEVRAAVATSPNDRTAAESATIRTFYLNQAEPLITWKKSLDEVQQKRAAVEAQVRKTVVSRATEPRTIRILKRGNWMDESGEVVQPAIPQFLGQLDTHGQRATRLDLARWLCAPDNPLTARTMVNRLWMLMFGRGICTSVDDFGGQGTFPTHPELLDWLAIEFVESGWDIKHILRLIATSQAYQRTSLPTPELRTIDPYNQHFARQARFRIEAEMVRDSILATSGLLVEVVGGPSVKPYQPDGYYAQLNFPRRTYAADIGENQYRRGVYTHWQRTFLHPMLKAFDAPSREECTAARSRSNTPLQALTLLNDPSFVEAARAFADRIVGEGGTTPEQRIAWAYRAAVSRAPEAAIAAELLALFERHRDYYHHHPQQAQALLATGQAPLAGQSETADTAAATPAELAAWTSVARVLFNLHETITRY